MEEYIFLSSDGKTNIHCVSWETEVKPKAVLLIVHGMCEYIERYSDFASTLAKEGYYVAGHDHLGHGKSIINEENFGFFGGKEGNSYLLSDIENHFNLLKEKFPDVPIFILGHSMGSFLARQFICDERIKLNGAIIMGTGVQSGFNLAFGNFATNLLSVPLGWKFRSNMIQQLAFGLYLRKIKNPRTKSDWLTKDESIVDEFLSKKECTFVFTLNGFHEMFKSIKAAQDINLIRKIPDELPLFMVSGDEDPVGDYRKGVNKAFNLYKSAKKNIRLKIYQGDRHEILNELDRVVVYNDIMNFIDESI